MIKLTWTVLAIEGISIGQNHNGTTSTVQVNLIIVITRLEAIEGISIGQNHNCTTSTVQVNLIIVFT
jgi:hypothetical protein